MNLLIYVTVFYKPLDLLVFAADVVMTVVVVVIHILFSRHSRPFHNFHPLFVFLIIVYPLPNHLLFLPFLKFCFVVLFVARSTKRLITLQLMSPFNNRQRSVPLDS